GTRGEPITELQSQCLASPHATWPRMRVAVCGGRDSSRHDATSVLVWAEQQTVCLFQGLSCSIGGCVALFAMMRRIHQGRTCLPQGPCRFLDFHDFQDFTIDVIASQP